MKMEEETEKEAESPKFPAFPYKPYDIQIDFMKALYHYLNKGGLSMLESPTGTGKTLSIICSALQWVVDRREQQKSENSVESDLNSAKDGRADSDDEPDWMRNVVINKDKQSEEKKTNKKEKFGVGFRRADKRVQRILWPDGIFITKHPKRKPPQTTNLSQNSPQGQKPTEISSPRLDEDQQQEADRRAKFVYELMIDNAPAAIVGLVGSKEYEKCAKDLYYFLQSSVCLKQLAFDLLELLLLTAFPEMDYVLKQLHEEKHRFGEFKAQ